MAIRNCLALVVMLALFFKASPDSFVSNDVPDDEFKPRFSLTSQSWYDCSEEVGIVNPQLVFSNVRSDPPVVTKDSGQVIYKTITYVPTTEQEDTDEKEKVLADISVDFTQMYYLFKKYWMTFLKVPHVNECKEHDGTQRMDNKTIDGPLCPLKANTPTHIFTIHPPLNKRTPYGMYRSRQVYHDGETGERIGCVDMQFEYTEFKGHEESETTEVSERVQRQLRL